MSRRVPLRRTEKLGILGVLEALGVLGVLEILWGADAVSIAFPVFKAFPVLWGMAGNLPFCRDCAILMQETGRVPK